MKIEVYADAVTVHGTPEQLAAYLAVYPHRF